MKNVAFILPSEVEYDLFTYFYFLKETVNEYNEINVGVDFIIPGTRSESLFSEFLLTISDRLYLIKNNKYNYTWSNNSLHSPLNVYYYLKDKNYKTIISFDTSAEAYFCIYSKSIGFSFTDVTFRVISVQPLWFPVINQGKMLSSVDAVILAGMEEFVVKNTDYIEGNHLIFEAIYNFSDRDKHLKSISHTRTYRVKPQGYVALYWGTTNYSLGISDFVKAVALIPSNKDIEVVIIATDHVDDNKINKLLEANGLRENLKIVIYENDLSNNIDVFSNVLFCYLPSIVNYYGLLGAVGRPEFPVIISKPLLLRGMYLGKNHMDYSAASSIYKYVENIYSLGFHDNLELSQEVTTEKLLPSSTRGAEVSAPRVHDDEEILVSVCIVHHNRPQLLRYALESILVQDCLPLEVIISDDGSHPDDVIEVKQMLTKEPFISSTIPIKFIEYDNSYLGAARNKAVRHANGSYILFMDDDNSAMPHEVSTLVRIARNNTNAFFVGSFMAVFTSNKTDDVNWNNTDIFAGIGCSNLAGMIQNNFSDANGLYKIEKLEELGGFSEDYGIGYEDWELFFKAQRHDMQVIIVPEPLFYYRINEGDSMARDHTSATINLNRVARALFQNRNTISNNNEFFYNMLFLQGLVHGEVCSELEKNNI